MGALFGLERLKGEPKSYNKVPKLFWNKGLLWVLVSILLAGRCIVRWPSPLTRSDAQIAHCVAEAATADAHDDTERPRIQAQPLRNPTATDS